MWIITRGTICQKRKNWRQYTRAGFLPKTFEDIGVTISHAARALRVPVNRITEIVSGKRGISADTALRLARYFGTSAQYWLNLQTRYDLQVTQDVAGECRSGENRKQPPVPPEAIMVTGVTT